MKITDILIKLIPFIPRTLLMAGASLGLGLVFGSLLAAMKLSRFVVLKKIAEIFTTFVRCTPTMVLLFLCYYGLPLLFAHIGIDISGGSKTGFSITALTIFASGILSEIIRPAYLSVPKGQLEAAMTVGMTKFQAMTHIIIPQTIFVALPNIGNMAISLVQESSLAYLIGVIDVMGQAKVINSISSGLHIIPIYFAVSIIYWLISLAIGRGIDVWTFRAGKVLR